MLPAILWYQLPSRDVPASEAADSGAMNMSLCSLAELYMTGAGVPRDPAKGLSLCREAADKKAIPAQTRMGLFLLEGDKSIRDLDQAFEWFSLAAQGNSAEAQYYLGIMLRDGMGRPKAPEDALIWFERAASLGYGPAYFPTGEIYFNSPKDPQTGKLSAHDLAKSYLWVSAAVRQTKGPEERKSATNMLEKILKTMPETWTATLNPKVDAHFATYPVQP